MSPLKVEGPLLVMDMDDHSEPPASDRVKCRSMVPYGFIRGISGPLLLRPCIIDLAGIVCITSHAAARRGSSDDGSFRRSRRTSVTPRQNDPYSPRGRKADSYRQLGSLEDDGAFRGSKRVSAIGPRQDDPYSPRGKKADSYRQLGPLEDTALDDVGRHARRRKQSAQQHQSPPVSPPPKRDVASAGIRRAGSRASSLAGGAGRQTDVARETIHVLDELMFLP